MVRFKIGFAAVWLWMPIAAQALTLGQVKVGSLFNEPLRAAIEIEAGNAAELDSLQVGLAPPARFAEQGVTRSQIHNELAFQVLRDANTRARVLVTTAQPIRDVFLEFVLEARWAGGQQVKGYTLLLDPPFTLDSAPDPIALPAQQPAATAKAEARPGAASQTAAKAPPAKPRPAPAKPLASGEIRVNRGDTLWDIASRIKPEEATVKQAIHALYRTNPRAFADNNVNKLRSGVVLRIPSRDEILALDPEESASFFAEHTRAWRSGAPLNPRYLAEDDEPRGPEDEPVAEAQPPRPPAADEVIDPQAPEPGLLRLASLSSSEADSAESPAQAPEADAGTAIDPAGFSDQLAVSREETAAARQEALELRARLDELGHQLEDTRRLLELKDEQLARLQAFFAEQNAALIAPAEAGADSGTPDEAPQAAAEMPQAVTEMPQAAAELTQDAGRTAADAAQDPPAVDNAADAGRQAAVTETPAPGDDVPTVEQAGEAAGLDSAQDAAQASQPASPMRTSLIVVGWLLLLLGAAFFALWFRRRNQAAPLEQVPQLSAAAGRAEPEAPPRPDRQGGPATAMEDDLDAMLESLESEVEAWNPAVTAAPVAESRDRLSPGTAAAGGAGAAAPPASAGPQRAAKDMAEVKLDLARVFVDLGDGPRARSLLEEVIAEGDENQRAQAQGILRDLA